MKTKTVSLLSVIGLVLIVGLAFHLRHRLKTAQEERNWAALTDTSTRTVAGQVQAMQESAQIRRDQEEWQRQQQPSAAQEEAKATERALEALRKRHEYEREIVRGGGALPAVTHITTNYAPAHPDFRVVNGQLYNTRYSTNWYRFTGEIFAVQNNKIVIREARFTRLNSNGLPPWPKHESRYNLGEGPRGFTHYPPAQVAVITNHRETATSVTGKYIKGEAMRVGTDNSYLQSTPYELWDCGTPNIVPVIVTNAPASDKIPAKTR